MARKSTTKTTQKRFSKVTFTLTNSQRLVMGSFLVILGILLFIALLSYLFTGEKINFGNYSCLTKQDIKTLSTKTSLWSSYSGSVKKNIKKLNEINSTRGMRYFGPSKMSLFNLVMHSFSIIAVFSSRFLLKSKSLKSLLSLIKS